MPYEAIASRPEQPITAVRLPFPVEVCEISPVVVDGETLIPRGAEVTGRVTQVKAAGKLAGARAGIVSQVPRTTEIRQMHEVFVRHVLHGQPSFAPSREAAVNHKCIERFFPQ